MNEIPITKMIKEIKAELSWREKIAWAMLMLEEIAESAAAIIYHIYRIAIITAMLAGMAWGAWWIWTHGILK